MLGKEVFSRSKDILDGVMEFVGASQIFEMSPVAFDQVEFRAVGWQPNDQETMFKKAESSQDSGAFMIRNIVHDQNYTACWMALDHQMLDELDEDLAIFPISALPIDGVIIPTISTQNMTVLLRAWM